MDHEVGQDKAQVESVSVPINHALISTEALLKTCYWFSRDFTCDVQSVDPCHSVVHLRAKGQTVRTLGDVRDQFMASAMDFALRERVTAKTADIRDLLLAKAFSESGVLEEEPQGVFGDAIEESKPDGMFKILSNR
jgi:His-Xaa-Ser system protein HxsD